MRYTLFILFFAAYSCAYAQYFMFGGYNYAAIDMKGANTIVQEFNLRENHSIGALSNNFHGYRIGLGKYSRHTLMELGFGNLISSQKSSNPNQLKENAEVVVNWMSANGRFGIKPFPKEFFTFGIAMQLGAQRVRYSFGGDYKTPVNQYLIGAEFYLDYAFKIRFLLKKSQRTDFFYLFRIRPYYQLQRKVGLGNFETELNQTPNVAQNAIEDNLSHFGFSISIVVPFISEEDRSYLNGSARKKKKKKKKKKRQQKEAPRGKL
jgi:hypothetical protein